MCSNVAEMTVNFQSCLNPSTLSFSPEMHTSLLLSGGTPVLVCTPYASQGYPGSLGKLHPGGPTLEHQW